MTDIGLVLHKLARLRDQVALTRARRPADVATLEDDDVLRDALAMALLVTTQTAIDIAYHVATDEGWGVPDSHAAAFASLAERGMIDASLATALAGIARVRNRIAHGYASGDHARIWAEMPAGLDALDELARCVARWLPDPA